MNPSRSLRRYELGVLAFSAAAFGFALLLVYRADFAGTSAPLLLVPATFFAILGVAAANALRTSRRIRPPDSLTVDDAGIEFGYSGGRIRTLRWDQRGFRLILFSTEGAGDRVSQGRGARSVEAIANVVPTEAFDEIIARATAHDLTLKVSRAGRSGWSRHTISGWGSNVRRGRRPLDPHPPRIEQIHSKLPSPSNRTVVYPGPRSWPAADDRFPDPGRRFPGGRTGHFDLTERLRKVVLEGRQLEITREPSGRIRRTVASRDPGTRHQGPTTAAGMARCRDEASSDAGEIGGKG